MSWVAQWRKEQDVGIGKVRCGDTISLLEKQIKVAVFFEKKKVTISWFTFPALNEQNRGRIPGPKIGPQSFAAKALAPDFRPRNSGPCSPRRGPETCAT